MSEEYALSIQLAEGNYNIGILFTRFVYLSTAACPMPLAL